MDSTQRKSLMRQWRTMMRGDTKCDLCRQAEGVQHHHMMSKWMTMNSPKARELADSVALAALLCQECHEVADLPENRSRLWDALKSIFGEKAVQFAHEQVKQYTNCTEVL